VVLEFVFPALPRTGRAAESKVILQVDGLSAYDVLKADVPSVARVILSFVKPANLVSIAPGV